MRLHSHYDASYTGATVYESTAEFGGRVWKPFRDWNALSGYVGWRWRGY